MIFLQPLFLLALLTIPLILILHLLRERRRHTSVPSLLHWLHVPRRREGERIRKLPLTLLLLLHLLAAGLLGLALGRPQLTGFINTGAHHTAIVIDLSTSMAAREGTTTRFDLARERALAILRALSPSDRATLIAAGPAAQIIDDGSGSDIATFAAALEKLSPGGTGTDLTSALTLAEAAFAPEHSPKIVVISDGALPNLATHITPTAPIDWQQIGSEQPNRAIVAFAARPWGTQLQLYARIANYSATPFATSLQLFGDQQLLDTRAVDIAAEGETELTWMLRNDYATLRVALDGTDVLPLDDQGFLSAGLRRPITVRLVSANPALLQRALRAIPDVDLTIVEPTNYANIQTGEQTPDLTILESFLPQRWPDSATLVINPQPNSSLLTIEPGQRIPEGELVQHSSVLEGLSLESVRFGSVHVLTPPPWTATQLRLGDTPLILRGRDGSHEIAIWTFDLAAGNLPSRLAFPLLITRTVRDLVPAPLPSAVQLGAQLLLRPAPQATTIQLTAPDGTLLSIPSAPTLTLNTLTQPGFYRIEEQQNGTAHFTGYVGANGGAAIESNLHTQLTPQINNPQPETINTQQRQLIDLWPWLALSALAILLIEWGYLHR